MHRNKRNYKSRNRKTKKTQNLHLILEENGWGKSQNNKILKT